MIKKYEEIQHFSFGNCIQPLVENTIIHSRDQNGEGFVTITGRLDEQKNLIICVPDGGVGVDTDQINRYIRGENVFEPDRQSFGIRNVYERLHLIYGDKGNLEYRHTVTGQTEAVITIKINETTK